MYSVDKADARRNPPAVKGAQLFGLDRRSPDVGGIPSRHPTKKKKLQTINFFFFFLI